MSKIDYLNIGDTIYVTGIEANLYECDEDNYETLLSVVNQTCKVVGVSDDVQLYYLPDVGTTCDYKSQRGVLIQNPKLQGHDGGGRCPEYNCYWIGKDYLSFESMSMDDTMNIFDKLNESDDFGWAEEIIKDVPNAVDYRTVKQGDKVVPGKDWLFGNQAQGSVYGIVDMEEYGGEPAYIEDSTDEEFWQYWVHVDWINKKGDVMFRNNYRVGPEYHDLKYYVPKPTKKKKIREGYWDERYKSKRYTQKFNIGDRVVVNGTIADKTFRNELGTILKYKLTGGGAGHPHRVYLILFDTWNDKTRNFLMSPVQADQNREFIDSRCRGGGCWYSVSDNLDPAPDVSGLFDKLNESEENIQEITHDDLQVGMTVIVDGYDVTEKTQKWENEIGIVVYNYNEDEDETGNSFTISFKDWANGHDGNNLTECGRNKCWSFYDDCAYSEEDNCQNIDGIKFYTVNTYDLFDQLNESEEDDFGWATETINQEYSRYEYILPYLDVDDIISITGDFTSDEGNVLLSVEDEPFKVSSVSHPMKKNKTISLKWVQPEDKRPIDWEGITNDYEQVAMGDDTSEWDKELMVKILHKEDHPF